MKFIALGLLCLVAAAAAMPVHRKVVAGEELRSYSITDYARDFAKTYTPLELVKRSAILKTNIERIIAHNALYAAGRKTWYAAVTKFSDRTKDEISAFKGYNRAQRFATYAPTHASGAISVGDLPADLDWRTTNNPKKMKAVTKPKDQAQCGSCWAFSTAETIESHIAIQTGSLLTLSEQQLVSCAPNPDDCGGTGGCEGNIQELGFNYTITAGITSEAHYPYTGEDSSCKTSKIVPVATIAGYVKLPENDHDALMNAVVSQGPIAISVAAEAWEMYGGGVFSDDCGWTVDHAVQLVGYGTDGAQPYWTVRNSWSEDWGEDGYIRILRAVDAAHEQCGTDTDPDQGDGCKGGPSSIKVCGECAILSDSSYPTGGKLASPPTPAL